MVKDRKPSGCPTKRPGEGAVPPAHISAGVQKMQIDRPGKNMKLKSLNAGALRDEEAAGSDKVSYPPLPPKSNG